MIGTGIKMNTGRGGTVVNDPRWARGCWYQLQSEEMMMCLLLPVVQTL